MTAPHPFIAPAREHATILADWLRNSVAAPHPDLGRRGAICPFIEPALDAAALRAYTYPLPAGNPPQVPELVAMLGRAREVFADLPHPERPGAHAALIVLLPDLTPSQWPLVDRVHAAAKNDFVERGLMLGQFHPDCRAPAVHNPSFPVNRSPIPLLAIRRMRPHDLRFLHTDPDWFAHYAQRFGHLYTDHPGTNANPLAGLYHATAARPRTRHDHPEGEAQ
ncbi:DUF6875 domain-containing protein [Streptomyces sp. TR02-1]|uniref:DUF6875 domain-containing protein n=1 Tax=Streptomyces sp. TR02-1 TaxID=3385977 RepID=UPI00399FF28F